MSLIQAVGSTEQVYGSETDANRFRYLNRARAEDLTDFDKRSSFSYERRGEIVPYGVQTKWLNGLTEV